MLFISVLIMFWLICQLQCFDAVGWVVGTSGLLKIWGDGGGRHWLLQMVGVSTSVNLPLHHKV